MGCTPSGPTWPRHCRTLPGTRWPARPWSWGAAARHYWWALALAPPALIALYPPVMGWGLDRALRLAKRPPLERRISGAGVLRAAAWSLAGWAFFSVHSWLLVAGV